VVTRFGRTNAGHQSRQPLYGGDARVGPMLGVPSLLKERGLEHRAFSQTSALISTCLTTRRAHLPAGFRAAAGGMRRRNRLPAFRAHGCPALRPEHAGAVGYLMRNAPTVGDALRDLQLHLHLNDRGAVLHLHHLDSQRVALVYTIFWHDTQATSLIYDAALRHSPQDDVRAVRASVEAAVRPVCHRPPEIMQPYRRFFGTNPHSMPSSPRSCSRPRGFDQPIPGADPVLRSILTRAIHQLEAASPTVSRSRCARALCPML